MGKETDLELPDDPYIAGLSEELDLLKGELARATRRKDELKAMLRGLLRAILRPNVGTESTAPSVQLKRRLGRFYVVTIERVLLEPLKSEIRAAIAYEIRIKNRVERQQQTLDASIRYQTEMANTERPSLP